MSKILLVEDDALIAGIYGRKLIAAGFEVDRAEDGLAAMKRLPEFQPDLVVLDLMMPKLSGADVLKFIRDHPTLKDTHVVVFSNAFLSKVGEQLVALGVNEMLLKSSATPELLIQTIRKVLNSPEKLTPPASRTAPKSDSPATAEVPPVRRLKTRSLRGEFALRNRYESSVEFRDRIRSQFFDQMPVITSSLREACQQFLHAAAAPAVSGALEALNRKVGFLTHMTGMAGCHRIAQLSSVLEAFLFELGDRPDRITESSRHTVESTVDLLAESLVQAEQPDEENPAPVRVLVVDDDAVSRRALSSALRRVKLNATSLSTPLEALKFLEENDCDVVLLDINLPGVNGLMLCEQMRQLPNHAQTPVIFVTAHTELAERARSILTDNDDVIFKPVMPMELTVKVITRDLKRRLNDDDAAPAD